MMAYRNVVALCAVFIPLTAQAASFHSYYDPADDVTEIAPSASQEELLAGGFTATATATTGLEYTDNVALSDNNTRSDIGSRNTARLTLASDWDRHALNAGGGGSFTRFREAHGEDRHDYYGFVDGRIDTSEETAILAGLTHRERTEERDDPLAPAGLSDRREFGVTTGNLGFRYEGPLVLSGKGEWSRTRFHSTIDGTDFSYEDHDTSRYALRVGYPVTEDLLVFVEPSVGWEEYDLTDPSGLTRDNRFRQWLTGVDYRFTDITRLELGAGRIARDFDDPALTDASGTALSFALSWEGVEDLLVKAAARRTIESTSLSGVNDLTATGASLLLRYDIAEDWQIYGLTGWDSYDYNGILREDDVLTFALGANYRITDAVTIGLDYRHRRRDSSAAGFDFTSNMILWTVSFTL